MKALVLGGTGFIGSHLVDRLLAEGHEVRVFDRQPEPYRPELKGVEYRWGSFGDKADFKGLLEGCGLVFHLISTTLPKTSNEDPGFDAGSNILPTLALLEACRKAQVKKVVFVSSGGTVYGEPRRLPASEEDPCFPLSAYGATKLSLEHYLHFYRHEHGLDAAVLRPSNAYGPRQNPRGIQGLIPVFMAKALKGEEIEVWGDGSVVRDYIYVDDLAGGIARAGLMPTPSFVYNLGSGQGYSVVEVAEKIRAVCGLTLKLKMLPPRAFDVPRIVLDISRAGRELKWEPVLALEEGLMRTFEFVKGLTA